MKKASLESGHFSSCAWIRSTCHKAATTISCRFTFYMSFDIKFGHAEFQKPICQNSHHRPVAARIALKANDSGRDLR